MAKIVCVEDEAGIREDIAEMLEQAGHTVIQAANGALGLAAILCEQPDLTISDVAMPEMNGHDLLRTVRNDHPEYAQMPIVFVSALSGRQDQISGRALGADDYLTKPVDFALPLAVVEANLRQVRRIRQQQERQLLQLCDALSGGAGLNNAPVVEADINGIHALIEAQGKASRHLLNLISKNLHQ